jgi:hypothetical protein
MQMIFDGVLVCGSFVGPYALKDLDDDVCITLCVQIDFLMIRDIPYVASKRVSENCLRLVVLLT